MAHHPGEDQLVVALVQAVPGQFIAVHKGATKQFEE